MPHLLLATRLVESLPHGQPGLFNPWRDYCADDLQHNTPESKLQRLAQHLACAPAFILCGEAPGYQGCVRSGIAFTSERLLIEGSIPRVTPVIGRLTERHRPFSEPSATIVWKALYKLGIAEKTVLWNAVQLHPYKPENPLSNRTPTPAEIALGAPAMRLLAEAFPQARIVAVGRKAEGLLTEMGVKLAGAVRHPANGGASAFAMGLAALASGAAGQLAG
jgi:uracil-DNA glycosylase